MVPFQVNPGRQSHTVPLHLALSSEHVSGLVHGSETCVPSETEDRRHNGKTASLYKYVNQLEIYQYFCSTVTSDRWSIVSSSSATDKTLYWKECIFSQRIWSSAGSSMKWWWGKLSTEILLKGVQIKHSNKTKKKMFLIS